MAFLSTVIVAGITIGQALTAAAIAFQVVQAKKARSAAKSAAEARKGFEMVIDGDISTLPIVYGRALVGGTRVYHQTASDFKHAPSNGNKTFLTGPPGTSGGSYEYMAFDPVSGEMIPKTQEYAGTMSGHLNRDVSGSKNEFLFFQQAICQGPINSVVDLIINDSQYLDDPKLGTVSNQGQFNSEIRAAFRADLHYNGGTACALMNANSSSRGNAFFTESAYATVAIRLDRDEPQFNGVPPVQFLIEGTLVRRVSQGALTSDKIYSNNPAWCLLDYLTHPRSGKSLSLDQIDLGSFESAAAVCDKIVQRDVVTGGKIFQPTDKGRNITKRDLPLYECNAVIDVTKPLRENVETILSTMGDARLVWSSGKYKLLLQYPSDNSQIVVATTLTDDDIERSSPVEINWPTSSERLNSCTVRFHNEAENFKEDSVSWPSKASGNTWRGIGGRTYPPASGWAEEHSLLNSYAVWEGSDLETTSMQWVVRPKVSGNYTLTAHGDDSWQVSVVGKANLSNNEWSGDTKSAVINLIAGTKYTITASATNTKGLKGVAAKLVSPDNNTFWTTRDAAYSDYIEVTSSNEVYLAMMAEDKDIELETDVFAEGVTDYYHALAKAEELVRTSRSAFGITFSYVIKSSYLEPGDIIKLQSDTLKLGLDGPLYIRVNELKVKEGGVCEVTGTRFDWTQLAWNVKDDEYLKPNNAYEFNIPAPQYLNFIEGNNEIKGSAGSLEWAHVSDSRRVGYALFTHVAGDMDMAGRPIFNEIGRATSNKFLLTNYINTAMIFGVKTVSSTGAMSSMTVTGTDEAVTISGAVPPQVTELTATVVGDQSDSIQVSWTIPAQREDGTDYADHYITQIFRSKSADFATAKLVGQVETNEFIERPTDFGNLFYWVKLVSLRGMYGPVSPAAAVDVEAATPGRDLEPPPTPTGFVVTPMFSTFQLMWDEPTYSIGEGHDRTLVYAAEWPEGAPEPAFANAAMRSAAYGSMFNYANSLGTRMVFWIKWQSKGGGVSEVPAGPVVSKTGLIGNVDLGPLIVEADNIAKNGVDITKFAEGLEPNTLVTSLPLTKLTEVVVMAGKVYRWDATLGKYTSAVPTVDLTGQIQAAQLATGAVDLTKFANGLQPATVVATLPTTKGTELVVVSGKLYHWDPVANKYSASVPTSDLSGTITAAQLADRSVDITKFADGLQPATVVTALPTVKTTELVVFGGKLYRWDTTTSKYVASIPTTDITGQIQTAQIATGAVDLNKFANGLQPNTILPSVPGTKQTEVIVVGGKLYRWDSGTNKYTAEVSTLDLTGQILAAQIATGAVDLSKFANGLQPNTVVGVLPTVKTTEVVVYNGKLYRWNTTASKYTAEISTTDLTGQITSVQITDDAISAPKIQAGAIVADKIAVNAVTANKIAVDSINAGHLQVGIVSADKIAASAITTEKLAADAVHAGNILAGAITTVKLATDSITSIKIAANAITALKIAAESINAAHLQAGIITADKIAAGTITTLQLAANSVTAGNILAGSITAVKLAVDSVTANAIKAGAITTDKIAANSINAAHLQAGIITADKIGAGAITAGKIATDAISAGNIQAGAIVAGKLAVGSVISDKIATNAVTSDKIIANSINAAHLQVGIVSADKIAANAVVAGKIATDAITAGNIQTGAITAVKLAAGSVTTEKIATNSITADKMTVNSISAAHIQSGIITADKLGVASVTAEKMAANSIVAGSAAIANGAIRNALIENAAIDNVKIANSAITEAKIGDAQIGTAKIANAAITSAKIANLAVDTLQIASNAVTIPVLALGGPATISMGSPSGPIMIDMDIAPQQDFPNTVEGYLKRNGTVIRTISIPQVPKTRVLLVDNPGPGVWTYTFHDSPYTVSNHILAPTSTFLLGIRR